MLSLASFGGPSDEELIREIEHLTAQILPELFRRFDARVEPEKENDDSSAYLQLRDEFEVSDIWGALETLRNLKSNLDSANARIAELDSELALIS